MSALDTLTLHVGVDGVQDAVNAINQLSDAIERLNALAASGCIKIEMGFKGDTSATIVGAIENSSVGEP